MSVGTSDILASRNLDRLSAVLGIAGTGNALINSNASTRDRLALGGALIGSVGGFLNGFNGNSGTTPTAGFDIQRFKSNIENLNGVASQNKFLVTISVPKWARNNSTVYTVTPNQQQQTPSDVALANIFSSIPFLCHATTLPGIQITPAAVRRYGYGSHEIKPGGVTYEKQILKFYVDSNYTIIDFFTKWMQNVVNFDIGSTDRRTVQGAFFNEIQYLDNYAAEIDIWTFDQSGNELVRYKLYEAYPVSLGGIEMAWESKNSIAILPVAFRFKTWKSNFVTPGMDSGDLRNLSIGDFLIRGGNILQTISGFNTRVRNVNDIINIAGNVSNITRIFTGR